MRWSGIRLSVCLSVCMSARSATLAISHTSKILLAAETQTAHTRDSAGK